MAYKIKPYDEYEDVSPEQRAKDYAKSAMGNAGDIKAPTIGSVRPVNYNALGMPIDRNTNYTQGSIDSAKVGNIPGAMFGERFHNEKDGAYGLGYGASGIFNYIDPKGYSGLKERKLKEIEDHYNAGFDYDYTDDPQYKAMRKLKEKEAEKAYKDGYAQLSRAFDGDIPVNMINKLLATKGEITDQADSYIPTLRQLAYNMYLGKGNALQNEYSMIDNAAKEDYNRWLTDRGYITQGIYDDVNRRYQLDRDRIADERYEDELQRTYINDAIKAQQYEDELKRKREQDAIDNYYKEWDLRIKQQNANKKK